MSNMNIIPPFLRGKSTSFEFIANLPLQECVHRIEDMEANLLVAPWLRHSRIFRRSASIIPVVTIRFAQVKRGVYTFHLRKKHAYSLHIVMDGSLAHVGGNTTLVLGQITSSQVITEIPQWLGDFIVLTLVWIGLKEPWPIYYLWLAFPIIL